MEIVFNAKRTSYGQHIAEALIFDGEFQKSLFVQAKTIKALDFECVKAVGVFFAERQDIVKSVTIRHELQESWTLVEYEEIVGYYEDKISEASMAIAEVKEAYLAMAPVKVGDKVNVTHRVTERIGDVQGLKSVVTEAFVRSVIPGNGAKKYEYSFFGARRDGAQSSRGIYITQIEKIEKI